MINDLTHRPMAKQGHADDTPNHHLHGQSTTVQRHRPGVFQALGDEFRGENFGEAAELLGGKRIELIEGLTEKHKNSGVLANAGV